MSNYIEHQGQYYSKLNPLKFGLWIGMCSIMMMFVAFTSAYLVRRSGGNWLEFEIPHIFYYSTCILLISSVLLHIAYRFLTKLDFAKYRLFLWIGALLGFVFLGLQVMGWQQLFNSGIDLKGNPSGSFLYVITGIHGLHVLGGLSILVVLIFNSFNYNALTAKRKLNFELALQYWHFVDILWVYLFIFLLISR